MPCHAIDDQSLQTSLHSSSPSYVEAPSVVEGVCSKGLYIFRAELIVLCSNLAMQNLPGMPVARCRPKSPEELAVAVHAMGVVLTCAFRSRFGS